MGPENNTRLTTKFEPAQTEEMQQMQTAPRMTPTMPEVMPMIARGSAPKEPEQHDEYTDITADMGIDLSDMVEMVPEDKTEVERRAILEKKGSENDEILALMDGALATEEDRLDMVENDQQFREKVIDAKEASGVIMASTVSREESKPARSEFGDDDFVPAYLDDDIEDVEESTSTTASDSDDEMSQDEKDALQAAKQLIDLPETIYEAEKPLDIVKIVRDRKTLGEMKKTSRFKEVGDQAFRNALTKMKRSNYRTTQVPLINSGFWADMVGTGATELIMLYSNVDSGMSAVDYEIEKMRTTIAGVVSTSPEIPMQDLRNRIHTADYQMMVFGRICATFKELSSAATCPECNEEFRYKVNPMDMLINADKMQERINQLRAAKNSTDLSLLKTDMQFTFDSCGITVTLGHPTYMDTVRQFNELQHYGNGDAAIPRAELRRMTRNIVTLSMIRGIALPDGTRVSNIYQKWLALGMLEEQEFYEIVDQARKMYDQAIRPQFGVKDIICPHCKKKVTIDNGGIIDDLVFLHSTVVQSEKLVTENAHKNG